MPKTGLNEIRENFLSFFEKKGHLRLPSASLIPQGDKSLLLINAGMAPLKKYFTGEQTPPSKRVTTCQKCIRTPDIDRVGKTPRHGTYFEMLGNFSFGDYFKKEAIEWAWEFCTRELNLPVDKIYVSVYEEDDEAYYLWKDMIGVAEDRIVRLGKEDNFWELGPGPCGPCSEIYYDRGEEFGCGSPDCLPGCECDRFTEFWNLVFTQFESDGKGNYKNLANPNIDTGMGLERMACIAQGVDNLFEVDTIRNILEAVAQKTGVNYRENDDTDVSLRVITDHIRSSTFLIGDGVLPSNEGRGYVLRRLLRRASRHGRLLGLKEPFLHEICESVIEENKNAYRALDDEREFIKRVILSEEQSFGKTVENGFQILEEIISSSGSSKEISGKDAFRLSDTFGFPLELTTEIAAERGFTVDVEEYAKLIEEQRVRARSARKNAGADGWENASSLFSKIPATEFTYDDFVTESKVLAVVGADEVNKNHENPEAYYIVLDRSPFYPESGGQLGDKGSISGSDFSMEVYNTTKTADGIILHHALLKEGSIPVKGSTVKAEIISENRISTARNHTATHLLQAALRQVLGNHVVQAGQEVGPQTLRFDFSHFSAMTKEELELVENIINSVILKALPVTIREMSIKDAIKEGAMALFEGKYEEVVRVVRVEDFSAELCGGTHVANTGQIGLIRILREMSVSAGVRRIEAVTGMSIIQRLNHYDGLLARTAAILKSNNVEELENKAAAVAAELKEKEKEISSMRGNMLSVTAKELSEGAKDLGGVKLIKAVLKAYTTDELRAMADILKEQSSDNVIVLANVAEGGESATILVACAQHAVKNGLNAGKIVREIASIAGGSGGGRPDSAMAGIKSLEKLSEAMDDSDEIILNHLNG
ncbi:MAG: alanine--tRNA ligase [Acutalibacteraceae bacterium]